MEEPAMKKLTKLPREENAPDGLPADVKATDDVEGHARNAPDELGNRLPGTGGDYRRPTSGGELTDDVEGHARNAPDELGNRLPGTGGDYRRPTSGGEISDDVEGHRQI
jgi:hypothetical protein